MFTALHLKDMGYITDGTSNTIGFSERCVTSQQGQPAGAIGPATDFSVRSGTWSTSTAYVGSSPRPAVCLNDAPDPRDRNTLHTPFAAWSGQLFGDGRPGNSGFNTVLPPNSPSCLHNGTGGGGNWGITSASSFHAGGVNGVFMDGSVRFIPSTINTGDLNAVQGGYHAGAGTHPVQSGRSNYGVWGALGTPQGGESVSL
jgi:prepilin-type processing-associated H-X9-DG protein